jgi:hypothetical protein
MRLITLAEPVEIYAVASGFISDEETSTKLADTCHLIDAVLHICSTGARRRQVQHEGPG